MTRRYQYQFLSEDQRRKAINATYFKRDFLVHVVVLITIVCCTLIYFSWKYGVEIDQFMKQLTK